MFLKIDGIDGEARDHKHKGEIELLSYSWGLAQTLASGGGGTAGKPTVQDFVIVKQIDKSSPKLMEATCTGQPLPSVQLSLVNKESQLEYLKVKLTDVLISSYQTGGAGAGGAVPVDQVSFNFTSVDIQAADKQGRFVSQVSCNFVKGGDGQIGHDHD
jgi:type VI secretion system secreted protein Hcp